MHINNRTVNYRPDIDGLRAVAVLLVLCFHFFPDICPAGYIGVDIFFVISGYLITSQVVSSLEKNKLNPLGFYIRRVRRIFPAFISVLVVSLFCGWFILTPIEYQMLGKHVSSAAGSLVNVILLSESGYFDADAIRKPLMHLWSLSIEEQFYVVWPALLWMAYRCRISMFWLTVSFAMLSFVANVVPALLAHFSVSPMEILPRMDPAARFYLLHYRFWEFLLGGLLASKLPAQLIRKNVFRKMGEFFGFKNIDYWVGDIISCGGFIMLLLSLIIVRPEHLLWGSWALFPTISALCFIAAGQHARINRYILSRSLLVGIGLISYPLYLWHWPILSFSSITAGVALTMLQKIYGLILSFVLAFLTYRYVECPLRYGRYLQTKALLLVVGMLAIASSGYYSFARGGLELRDFAVRTEPLSRAAKDWDYPGNLQKLYHPDLVDVAGRETYIFGAQPPEIIFVGDSHINQYVPRLKLIAEKQSSSFILLSGDGCSVIPYVYGGEDLRCIHMLEDLQRLLLAYPSIKTIVLANYWYGYFNIFEAFAYKQGKKSFSLRDAQGKELALDSLKKLIVELKQSHEVYVMLDIPSSALFDPMVMIGNRLLFDDVNSLKTSVVREQEQVSLNAGIRAISLDAGARVIDPTASLCANELCLCIDPRTQTPIYKDSDHLTARYVAEHASYIDEVFTNQ